MAPFSECGNSFATFRLVPNRKMSSRQDRHARQGKTPATLNYSTAKTPRTQNENIDPFDPSLSGFPAARHIGRIRPIHPIGPMVQTRAAGLGEWDVCEAWELWDRRRKPQNPGLFGHHYFTPVISCFCQRRAGRAGRGTLAKALPLFRFADSAGSPARRPRVGQQGCLRNPQQAQTGLTEGLGTAFPQKGVPNHVIIISSPPRYRPPDGRD